VTGVPVLILLFSSLLLFLAGGLCFNSSSLVGNLRLLVLRNGESLTVSSETVVHEATLSAGEPIGVISHVGSYKHIAES